MHQISSDTVLRESCDKILLCEICHNLFDVFDHQPKFLLCHHTFCKSCLEKSMEQSSTHEIRCSLCGKISNIPCSGVCSLQTNPYIEYIQAMKQGSPSMMSSVQHQVQQDKKVLDCHPEFHRIRCDPCDIEEQGTKQQSSSKSITTEQYRRRLELAFTRANTSVERKRSEIDRALSRYSEDKDHALMKIESSFEQLTHVLSRRATTLKNSVVDIYNAQVNEIDVQLEDLSTAITCLVSLKDYHDTLIAKGNHSELDQGLHDIEYVQNNVEENIVVPEGHIKYDDDYSLETFRGSVKDIGRVRLVVPPNEIIHHFHKMSLNKTASPDGLSQAESESAQLLTATCTSTTNNAAQPVLFYTNSDVSLPALNSGSTQEPALSVTANPTEKCLIRPTAQPVARKSSDTAMECKPVTDTNMTLSAVYDHLFTNSYSYDETKSSNEEDLFSCTDDQTAAKFLSRSAVFTNEREANEYYDDEHKYVITEFSGEQTSL